MKNERQAQACLFFVWGVENPYALAPISLNARLMEMSALGLGISYHPVGPQASLCVCQRSRLLGEGRDDSFWGLKNGNERAGPWSKTAMRVVSIFRHEKGKRGLRGRVQEI